jgi:hypothetical protein
MEDMLIEDIVESTWALPFWTNLKVDMADFVNPHKVVVKKLHFQPFQVHKIKVNPKN